GRRDRGVPSRGARRALRARTRLGQSPLRRPTGRRPASALAWDLPGRKTNGAAIVSRASALALGQRLGSVWLRTGDGLGGEAVADPEVGVDVAPHRRDLLQLRAQLAHEDIDRAVAVGHLITPHALVDLAALEHLAGGLGEQL